MSTNYFHLHLDPAAMAALTALQDQGAQLMALTKAVQDKLDAVQATLASGFKTIVDAAAGISTDIQALKDKIAAGGMSEAEILAGLDGISKGADDITTAAKSVQDIDVANP